MSWMSHHPQRRTGRPTAAGSVFSQRDKSERWSRHSDQPRFDSGCRRVLTTRAPAFSHSGFTNLEAGSIHSVLIVEDDDFGRETLSSILEADGYRVLRAANGGEALDHLHGRPPPSLVILDLMLPILDGWQLIEKHEDDPELASIPVIVVSAADPATLPSYPAGIVALFEKPIAVRDLLATIRQQLSW